ncbi:MAG: hypothetical protein Q8P99_01225 [bacterium]|nr:hypothetical protein [bacterium]MDZ4231188.1 hypothetical protein [Patescibacteria group bacterium]
MSKIILGALLLAIVAFLLIYGGRLGEVYTVIQEKLNPPVMENPRVRGPTGPPSVKGPTGPPPAY